MEYYKANRECYDYFNARLVLQNELLTKKERDTIARYISDLHFNIVDISRKKTEKKFIYGVGRKPILVRNFLYFIYVFVHTLADLSGDFAHGYIKADGNVKISVQISGILSIYIDVMAARRQMNKLKFK